VKLRHTPISLPATDVWLDGLLAHAPDVRGLALIPQTSVGNHRDSRDAYVAAALQREGFATLILDLITRYEHNRDPDIRYNIPLLTRRVIAASDWLGHQPPLKRLAVGILGAATGSGAVVRAAAKAPERFDALVCRGGRPDLAGAAPLRALRVPMRFLVGSEDTTAPILQQAYGMLTGPHDWQVVPGAGELFAEPGALEAASLLAAEWFQRHLSPPAPQSEEPDEPPPQEPEKDI
jgi:dienelactone hydrolase